MKSLLFSTVILSLTLPDISSAGPLFISPDGSAVITTTGLTSIPSGSIPSGLIASGFPGWSIVNGGAGPGTVTTPTYTAGGNASSGGAQIIATYSKQDASSGWIQIVTTNDPLSGQSSPRVDVLPVGETVTPLVPPSFVSPFHDFSQRNYSALSKTSPINWSASLFPVEQTGSKVATVYNGINWGWTMAPALAGNSSGKFLNPSPSCPPATCSGTKTNSFSWD